ncbi:MAG: hypothetical protein JNJ41_18025 [Bacteroidia bacterium]|nr:hypothetical protein [Bacteroidia bacterium]
MKKIVFILQILVFLSGFSASALSSSLNNDSLCDLVILKNGDEVKAKVLEITPIEIKYKKCLSPDGPLYVVKKNDVFMIKYSNGTKEVIKGDNPMSDSSNSGDQKNTKEEEEHIKQCEANSRWAHRIFLPIGAILAALYIVGIVLSSR